jgi:uncharacterized protein YbjT (DUF2867 family)
VRPCTPEYCVGLGRADVSVTCASARAGRSSAIADGGAAFAIPGTGPIVALHRQEQRLNALAGVDVLHLRPGYFFENHLLAIGMIPTIGVYADMTAPDAPLPMVATADIAQVVARELRTPSGNGIVSRVWGDDLPPTEQRQTRRIGHRQ